MDIFKTLVHNRQLNQFLQDCKAYLILIAMSHDMNLINANHISYLNPLSSLRNQNQTQLEHLSFNASTVSNQNLKSLKTTGHNFHQNYTKGTQQPFHQIDQALNQNHQTLKKLIQMIDNRKSQSILTGLSSNNYEYYQKSNRFSRRQNEEVNREKRNFVEDLKQVKQKMNQMMRLIDIKIKVNQQQIQNSNTLVDLDLIKEKLTIQSARLDILQRDNSIQLYSPKDEDKNSLRREYVITRNINQNKQRFDKQRNIVAKTQNEQFLHINKFNHSKHSSAHISPQFSRISYKQHNEGHKNSFMQTRFTQKPQTLIRQPLIQQKTYLQRSNSVDNQLYSSHPNNLQVVHKTSSATLKDSNISNRFNNNHNRFYNPNSFGRPISNIPLHPNTLTVIRTKMPQISRPNISHFSPLPIHYSSPPVPFRSQQKAIIRQWDEESRPDISFGLNSSLSTLRNGQSSTNLKKSSKNNHKFSFIQHFANNPEARKRRQEPTFNNQVKQSIVQYALPQIIPRQQNVPIQNPFQEWNTKFNQQKNSPKQEIRINDNSMRTVIYTSEPKNKESIIQQASFLDSSKSGSKPSRTNMPQAHLIQGGSVYKKKKKGLEVSKRMNHTAYNPHY